MRVNPFLIPVLFIAALLGTSLTAQVLGLWSVSGKVGIDFTSLTSADLKGWMTLQQVIDGLPISKEDVYAAGNIPADIPTDTALKDLETIIPNFSTTDFRLAIETHLHPQPVVTTPAEPPTPESTATAVHDGGTGPTPLPIGEILPADEIKGRLSLQEVSDQCAVPLDNLLTGLNLPADTDPQSLLKDLVVQGKITEVTDVQVVVKELQQP